MHISSRVFQHQFNRFKEAVRTNSTVGGFKSFDEGLAAEWEEYKQDVRNEAIRRLQWDSWTPSDVGTGVILDRVVQAIEIKKTAVHPRNNLVEWEAKSRSKNSVTHLPLVAAQSKKQAPQEIEQCLLDLFQSRVPDAEAFERFTTLVNRRYELVAYLFFLKDWTRYMPIRTTTFDEAFRLLEFEHVTAYNCNWANYQTYNAAIGEIRRLLREVAELDDVRLIDAHSFCWMLVKLEVPLPAPRAEVPVPEEIDVTPDATQPPEFGPRKGPFRVVTGDEFDQRDKARRRLGNIAQDVALSSERRRLKEAGHEDPNEAAVPVWDEPGRGYDILSQELDGSARHIEVKATRQTKDGFSFIVSRYEIAQSRALPNYYFYLVLDAESDGRRIIPVDSAVITEDCLVPRNYVASLRRSSG